MRFRDMLKKFSVLLLALLIFGGAAAENINFPYKEEVYESSQPRSYFSTGTGTLYCDRTTSTINQYFYLSWEASYADYVYLYKMREGGKWENLGQVEKTGSSYAQSICQKGTFYYTLMTMKTGEDWVQSNIIRITIVDDGSGIPYIYSDREKARVGETFYLIWDETGADEVKIYRYGPERRWDELSGVGIKSVGYAQSFTTPGDYWYQLMTRRGDQGWVRSDSIKVVVTEEEEEDPGTPANDVLIISAEEAQAGETVTLTWNLAAAEVVNVYSKKNSEAEWEYLGRREGKSGKWTQTFSEPGLYYMTIMILNQGEWTQSNIVELTITASVDEDEVCRNLAAKGYDNVWNTLIIVYRNARVGSYSKSFTDAQISDIRKRASQVRLAINSLSAGRWVIGSADVIVVDEPITSVSVQGGYRLKQLSYGPGNDVDFNYIIQHKDIQHVTVYAPINEMISDPDWLGLGGGMHYVDGRMIYVTILNDIDTSGDTYTLDGTSYRLALSAHIHEMLHSVETNSRNNGWKDFQLLHDFNKNGYAESGNGNFPWYQVLIRNTLKNGRAGFLKYSFYVPHTSIPAEMSNGLYTDYDNVTRYYVNGLPVQQKVDLVLPASLKRVEAEAFRYLEVTVYVPASVVYIGENAFGPNTTLIVHKGSAAETWAKQNGAAFVEVP